MADQPLTLSVFEEFQQKIFSRFDALDVRLEGHDQRFVAIAGQFDAVARRFESADRRFDFLQAQVDARFDQVVGQIDAVLHRLLSLDDEVTFIKEGLSRVEWKVDDLQSRGGELDQK